ncbi:MAG: hypothetical protein IPG17_21285 [Sandaracinaceae bacterium]|nr:hypothetical protein [Sandaracinaceae bacterium]
MQPDNAAGDKQSAVRSPRPPRPEVHWTRERIVGLAAPEIAPRDVQLLIPTGVAPPEGGWPFLLVMDGQSAFEPTFAVDTHLMALVHEGLVEPCVVIAVPSVARSREFTPTDHPTNVRRFAAYLVDVVLPAVALRVPLRDAGAILGFSYGGLAAVWAGLLFPQRFAQVFAHSPSLWFDERAVLRAVQDAPRLPGRWWVDVGGAESDVRAAVPPMVSDARALRDVLIDRGFELGGDLGYHEAPGRPHAAQQVGGRMRRALRFGFGPRCPGLPWHADRGRTLPRRTELDAAEPRRELLGSVGGGAARWRRCVDPRVSRPRHGHRAPRARAFGRVPPPAVAGQRPGVTPLGCAPEASPFR